MSQSVNGGETKILGIRRDSLSGIGVFAAVLVIVVMLFTVMNSNRNHLSDKIDETNAALAELAAQNAAQNSAQNAKLEALSVNVAANGEAIADLNNRVGNVETRVGNVETSLGKVEARLDNIERRLPDVEKMDDRLDDLEQGQSALKQDQRELRELVDALIIANAE